MMGNLWLQRLAPRPQAMARLICFPHAGVGAAVYRFWPAGLPEELDVCAVQLPGRANRFREPALASIPALVDALVPALMPHLDLPFALFGHSMGAVLACEVARALQAGGWAMPKHLIVSGRRPPHVPDPDPPLSDLTDDRFVAEICRRYGGIPAEVLEHEDLMALLLPCLRADVAALEAFQPQPAPPLHCPISVFGGAEDNLTPRHHLDAWRAETRDVFRVRVFPGDHFYLEPRRADVLADLSATLAPMFASAETREVAV